MRTYRYYSEKLERWITGKTDKGKVSQRSFSRKEIRSAGNALKYTYSIVCSKCQRKEESLPFNGEYGKNMSNEKIASTFRDKGWNVILTKAGSDTCQGCKPTAGIKMNGNGAATPNVPREMDIEAKRRINGKLSEVYDRDHGLYGTGWTDRLVSDDLKFPQAWVRSVREELYGPETNSDIERIKEDIDLFRKEHKSLNELAAAIDAKLSLLLKSLGR